ncbi:MAG: hypothetical protein ACREX4_08940 [Gammaproteobacteria bacterium]
MANWVRRISRNAMLLGFMKIVFVNRFFHPDQSATSQLATALCVLIEEWDLQDRFVVCYSGNMGRAHEL